MGADVYLQSVSNKCREEWEPKFKHAVAARDRHPRGSKTADKLQEKVMEAYNKMFGEGYFRDSYNSYGLFANLKDMSWWRDVIPMLDDNGYLPIAKAMKLKAMVENAPLDLTRSQEVASQQNDKEPEGGWEQLYENHRKELLDILQQSIDTNEPLYMSL
jgi:hypothetical protein